MNKLVDLYTPKPNDKVVSLIDANGFTLVSDYPEGRDGVSIFLRLFVEDEKKGLLAGSVNRVKSEESEGGGHSILNNDDPKGRVTNYLFFGDEGFSLSGDMITHSELPNPISVDNFVSFLIHNHTTDKLSSLRRKQFINEKLVNLTFWLVDLRFKDIKLFDFEGSLRNLIFKRNEKLTPDPFLKYFYIPRNMLGTVIILGSLVTIVYYCAYYFNPTWEGKINPPEITNLLVVLYTASVFVILEFVANKINNAISGLDTKFKTPLGKRVALIYGLSRQEIKMDFSFIKRKKYEG